MARHPQMLMPKAKSQARKGSRPWLRRTCVRKQNQQALDCLAFPTSLATMENCFTERARSARRARKRRNVQPSARDRLVPQNVLARAFSNHSKRDPEILVRSARDEPISVSAAAEAGMAAEQPANVLTNLAITIYFDFLALKHGSTERSRRGRCNS